jgi:hypothetical protein
MYVILPSVLDLQLCDKVQVYLHVHQWQNEACHINHLVGKNYFVKINMRMRGCIISFIYIIFIKNNVSQWLDILE